MANPVNNPSGLVERARPGSPPYVELRQLLARVNYFVQYLDPKAAKAEMDQVWAPLSDLEKNLLALQAFKEEWIGDPFGVAARLINYGYTNDVVHEAAIRSACVALNMMIARARTAGIETEINASPTGIGVGLRIWQRKLIGEVVAPAPATVEVDDEF